MKPTDINSDQFEEKVLKAEKAVLVDFWAPWCMPCLMMAPILEELAADKDLADKLEIIKVDTDAPRNRPLAATYNIMSIPNMKLFKGGKVIGNFVGLRPAEYFKKELLEALAA